MEQLEFTTLSMERLHSLFANFLIKMDKQMRCQLLVLDGGHRMRTHQQTTSWCLLRPMDGSDIGMPHPVNVCTQDNAMIIPNNNYTRWTTTTTPLSSPQVVLTSKLDCMMKQPSPKWLKWERMVTTSQDIQTEFTAWSGTPETITWLQPVVGTRPFSFMISGKEDQLQAFTDQRFVGMLLISKKMDTP